jgi:oxaloacetate decarboxylase alpha subunit
MFAGTDRDTGLNLQLLEEIAAYFREVRKKYAKFEGSLKGIDSRILVAQVPGGMLTNMENQLREQGASDRLDEVLEEIPRVRKDLGYLPLVTPTSQIVGTQAVLNVLTGERYKTITKETSGVLRGEYGATPAPVSSRLQQRVLSVGEEPITCRPADNLAPEMESLTAELEQSAQAKSFELAENEVDDVLIYALFPQVGLKFLENRGNPTAFEPPPWEEAAVPAPTAAAVAPVSGGREAYRVEVNGKAYHVTVCPQGTVQTLAPARFPPAPDTAAKNAKATVDAPLAGNIYKIKVALGQAVKAGEVVLLLEAMKMETEVRAPSDGVVDEIRVKEGDSVSVGDVMLVLANPS